MDNVNNNYPQQGTENSGSGQWNDQNKVVNEQDQIQPINTGDEEYKENVTGRTPEQVPRDLSGTGSYENDTSSDSEGGAEIETPHPNEGNDELSTERKLPKM